MRPGCRLSRVRTVCLCWPFSTAKRPCRPMLRFLSSHSPSQVSALVDRNLLLLRLLLGLVLLALVCFLLVLVLVRFSCSACSSCSSCSSSKAVGPRSSISLRLERFCCLYYLIHICLFTLACCLHLPLSTPAPTSCLRLLSLPCLLLSCLFPFICCLCTCLSLYGVSLSVRLLELPLILPLLLSVSNLFLI